MCTPGINVLTFYFKGFNIVKCQPMQLHIISVYNSNNSWYFIHFDHLIVPVIYIVTGYEEVGSQIQE